MLGGDEYSTGIDMWSVGCIFAELFTKVAIFKTENETDQIQLIFSVIGSSKDEDMPGFSKLPNYFSKLKANGCGLKKYLESKFNLQLEKSALDLLEALLQLDPSKRISAREALESDYFKGVIKVINYQD